MHRTTLALGAIAAAFSTTLASDASAQVLASEATPVSAGSTVTDFSSGRTVSGPTVVFSSIDDPADLNEPAVARAFSGATDAFFGDALTLTDTGTLDEFEFSFFNSGNSSGQVQTASVDILFFDAATFTAGDHTTGLIGGFGGNLDYTGLANGGLDAGFFVTSRFNGLSGLATPIEFTTTDIVVVQQFADIVGGANLTGVVGYSGTPVGAQIPQLYIESSTVAAGAPGFYNITSAGNPADFNTAYEVLLVPEPASLGLLGFAGLALARRRR
ncbi:MAG: PEP-CTERM sorting domain-containing protein [Planctomycetota bacterium]